MGCRDLGIGITFSSDSGTLQLFLRCHCIGLMCSQPRWTCFSVAINRPIKDMNWHEGVPWSPQSSYFKVQCYSSPVCRWHPDLPSSWLQEFWLCRKSVQDWMDGVKLKLNPEKTEFIIIGQKAIRESLAPNFPVPLLQNNISPSVEVRNLGGIFDSDNSFDNHVAKVCRACYYHLRDLRWIRKFLEVETAILLANAMVSSCLDYCNSLLYGVSKSNIAKLQTVQNALCRIIFRLDKMSHVTPFLKKLHWLPIQHRILFKYNLLVFKAINLSQPLYLSALIRSSSLTRGNRLSISSTRPNKHIGRRGFAVAAPAELNKLPQTVRSQQTIDGFRSQLKTYLFRLAYPPP